MEDPAFSLLNFENVKSSKDLNVFDIIFVGKGIQKG